MLLAKLLNNNWEEDHTSINQEYLLNTGLDPLYILTNFLHKANFIDLDNFIFATQLDIKEPKTYKQTMSCSYAQQWVYTIQ